MEEALIVQEKGADSLIKMNLTFEEAVFGCKKTININTLEECSECHGRGGHNEKTCSVCHGTGQQTVEQRTMFGTFASRTTCTSCNGTGHTYETKCTHCRGTGKVNVNKDIELKVPAGVDTGNRLRLAGKGEAGVNGGPNGDVYVEFKVASHPLFEREDSDIYLTLPITITEAVLGTKKMFQHFMEILNLLFLRDLVQMTSIVLKEKVLLMFKQDVRVICMLF